MEGMRMKGIFNVAIAGLLVIGCGGDATPDLGPETEATPGQQSAITMTEQSLTQLASADTQGSASGFYALSFATSELLLIEAGSGASGVQGPLASARLTPGMISAARQAALADCAVVTASSVVWHQCTQNGVTIDGMISWSPGHVDVDMRLSGSASGVTFDYRLAGSMTVSTSAIHGDVTVTASASNGSTSASEMVHSQIDVEVTNGCISSGTLTVTASGSGTGARNGAVQVVWTGCQMFRVRNS